MDQDERRAGVEDLYAAHAASVRGYLRQRTDAATADDLLSDVFVVAWRRLERIPPDPVPWLLACARHVLAHSQRSERRRTALIDRLRDNTQPETVPVGDGRGRLAEALAKLGQRDREALLLIAWDDLSPEQAAAALGCSRRAFAMRLHRERKRLAAALSATDHLDTPSLTRRAMTDVMEMLAAVKRDVSDESVPPVDDVWRKLGSPTVPQNGNRRSLRATGVRRRRSLMRWATVGVSAVATVVAVLVVGTTGSGPTSALAGWSADPTRPASGQLQAAEASCETARVLPSGLASVAPSLVDTRGPYTMLVYSDNAIGGLCLAAPASGPPVPGHLSVTDATAIAPDAIHVGEDGALFTKASLSVAALSWIAGRAGTDVTAVTLTLADGTNVEATTSDSWFAAWWPEGQSPRTAEITTTTSTVTQQLVPPATALRRPPATALNGGAQAQEAPVGATGSTSQTGGSGATVTTPGN